MKTDGQWKQVLILLFVSLIWSQGATSANKTENPVCAHVRSLARPGDLLFLEIDNFLFRRVAEATQSWTSHVGIIFQDSQQNWYVAESTIPYSRQSGLCDYIARSRSSHVALTRYRAPLSVQSIRYLSLAADRRMNEWYDSGFDYNSNRQFCSKFVYDTFKEATQLEVGQLETFADLRRKNPNMPEDFWRTWFMGDIPWERTTVTPASQLLDEDFEVILETSL